MRRIDRVILGDIVGPWVFGVAMFTVLIMAGQFLFQFTNYIVKGVSPMKVAELVILSLPGVVAMTFPMAVLLACLLGFGRLSGDSEITAMRACGTSLVRIMVPVAAFGLFVAVLTFVFREFVVPGASSRAVVIQQEISAQLEGKSFQPTSYPVFDKGVLKATINAKAFDLGQRKLMGVNIITYEQGSGKAFLFLEADSLTYDPKQTDGWRIEGKARIVDLKDMSYQADVQGGIWPQAVPSLKGVTPEDISASSQKSFDSQPMEQLARRIETASRNPSFDPSQLRNMQYIYWNKVAIPLAALVYSLVGAPLGIRNHRTGAAAGFWIAILIIFAYFLLGNVLGVSANGGAIPPVVAAFLPVAIGLAAAAYTIKVKNG